MENGLSAVDFRVKISASQEKEREYMEKGLVFGLSIGELLTIYDLDSQSWKMSECLFTGDLAKYSEALQKSGMMRNGKIYEQSTWVRRTGEKGYGLLPTPQAIDGNGRCIKYPTPTARDCRGGRLPETLKLSGRTENNSLNDKVNSLEKTTGQLNPQWVDWLMGYPVGWTDLKDSVMRLSLK